MKMLSRERKPYSKPVENAPNALRAFRLHVEKSLQAVAKECGCHFQNLSAAELRGGKLGVDEWCALADYYGVSVQVLRNPLSDPTSFAKKVKPAA
jgi:hypothetical protein